MKNIKKILITISSFIPASVFAQTGNTNYTIQNPVTGANDLTSLLTLILNNVVMPVAAVAVVLWIIWAGFTFVTAQGKPAEIQKAKQRLMWSLIGAAILLGASGIAIVVKNTVSSITTF